MLHTANEEQSMLAKSQRLGDKSALQGWNTPMRRLFVF